MSGRRTLVSGLSWVGLIVGASFVALTMRSVTAEELYSFADEASLAEAMAALNGGMAHDAVAPDPCRLHILDDLRGHALFDDATFTAMRRALAADILGAERVDGCSVETHEVGQDDVANFLEQRRAAGDAGLVLALSYYKLDEGVTVFASLRSEGGDLLGSSGRFDLPVTADAGTGNVDQADAGETSKARAEGTSTVAKQGAVVTKRQPTASDADADASETTLRRQLAAEAEIAKTPSNPFNLRRVQAGIPPSIRTVRIVDASGREKALMADLGERFLDVLERSPERSAAAADVEVIDIEVADSGVAFEQILDNEADIVVTREPISSADAARFAGAYGVNMRSRYAEHVVAIAARKTEPLDCGIRYPENAMLMSTEDNPSSERVYIYVNPSIPGSVRDQFIDFALSAEGQAVVAEHAVDLRLQLSDAGYAAWRYQTAGEQNAELLDVLERFRRLIRTSQRVSSTFRFDFASADLVLDSRSEQDLENLIDLVKARDIDSRRILLFGFADSSGAAPFNVDLSRSRADAVAIRLRLAGIPVPPRNVHGIGEDSPVACNVQVDGDRDEVGARKNRRVEVWIES